MTPEEFKRIGDQAAVSVAAGSDCMWPGDLLHPSLWEALRQELQRRYRRSTGETMATLTVEIASSAAPVAVETGAEGRGCVCSHGIRWPWACDDCDRAALPEEDQG